MTLHHNAFKPIHLKASLKAGLLISFCAHTAVAGAMMWFGSGDPAQSKQEEFEALEAKSVAATRLFVARGPSPAAAHRRGQMK